MDPMGTGAPMGVAEMATQMGPTATTEVPGTAHFRCPNIKELHKNNYKLEINQSNKKCAQLFPN